MKRPLVSILLLLACLQFILWAAPPVASAYEGDPDWSDCELCERYQVPWACWGCVMQMWWDQGWDCFPSDPNCC